MAQLTHECPFYSTLKLAEERYEKRMFSDIENGNFGKISNILTIGARSRGMGV